MSRPPRPEPNLLVVQLSVRDTDGAIVNVMRQMDRACQEHARLGKPFLCTCVLTDYNDDPRALDEIPEVQPFCARLWELGLPSFLAVSTSIPDLVPHPCLRGCVLGLGAWEVWRLAHGQLHGGLNVFSHDVLRTFVEKELVPLNQRAACRLADPGNN
jgi:hypothetical protein